VLKINRRSGRSKALLSACFRAFSSLGLPSNLEDGNDIFIRKVGWLSADYIA
jgi:hypothetical protein